MKGGLYRGNSNKDGYVDRARVKTHSRFIINKFEGKITEKKIR